MASYDNRHRRRTKIYPKHGRTVRNNKRRAAAPRSVGERTALFCWTGRMTSSVAVKVQLRGLPPAVASHDVAAALSWLFPSENARPSVVYLEPGTRKCVLCMSCQRCYISARRIRRASRIAAALLCLLLCPLLQARRQSEAGSMLPRLPPSAGLLYWGAAWAQRTPGRAFESCIYRR